MPPVRVLHVGLGPIGAAALRLTSERGGLRLVGGVDIDPKKTGRDVGDVADLGRRTGLLVSADLGATLRATRPHLVVHCTGSSLAGVLPEIRAALSAGAAVVSTTEELAYPAGRNAAHARTIDRLARQAGVAVLGTGVNPGFAMDALPVALSAACERVTRIRVDRVQDARIRRRPFQEKIGAGLSVAAFLKGVRDGRVRHVGLSESIAMIADAFGWRLDRIDDRIRPKVAEAPVASRFVRVAAGQVAGIVQDGLGHRDGRVVVRLHMEAYLGAPETYDAVVIDGSPRLSMRMDGGIHGDIATPALVVNSIPRVLAAPPGLRTMLDLPLPSFFPGFSAPRS